MNLMEQLTIAISGGILIGQTIASGIIHTNHSSFTQRKTPTSRSIIEQPLVPQFTVKDLSAIPTKYLGQIEDYQLCNNHYKKD